MKSIYNNINNYHISIIVFLVMVSLFAGCKSNASYKVYIAKNDCNTDGNLSKDQDVKYDTVKIFFESSSSLKGYLNKENELDDGYLIKNILPTIYDLLKYQCSNLSFFKINDTDKCSIINNIEIFGNRESYDTTCHGKSNIINIFKKVISSVNSDTGISLYISDCIPDIGVGKTDENKLNITATIQTNLKDHPNLGALLFQYYSNFNGDWYYNEKGYERPFKESNIVMKNRPFYVWVFGTARNLNGINNKVEEIGEFTHSFAYGILFPKLKKPHFIEGSESGAVFFADDTANEFTLVNCYKESVHYGFSIGLDLSVLPAFVKTGNYLRRNIHLYPEYLTDYIHINISKADEYLNNSSGKEKKIIAREIGNNGITHILNISFTGLEPDIDTLISIVLDYKEPEWINETNIDSDTGINAKELEGKTFAFKTITDAFSNRFLKGKNDCIFKINIKKTD